MSTGILALIGVLGIALFVFLMMRGKTSMIPAFILVIVLIPLCAGRSMLEISDDIVGGIQSTGTLGFMAAFAVLFFTMMGEVGVFDTIVGAITKRLSDAIYPVLLATMIISIASHLDGQAPSTILVTVTTMYPIYRKLKIRPAILALIIAVMVGIWNFLPWGGVNLTNSVVMQLDAVQIFNTLLPSMIIMTVLFGIALFFVAKNEKKRIEAGLNDNIEYKSILATDTAALSERTKKLLPFNIILTVVVLVVLFMNKLNTAVVFMMAYTVGVLVNYNTIDGQYKQFKDNANSAFNILIAMVLGGIFGNVLNNSGVLSALVQVIVSVFPAGCAPYMLIIFGILAFPLGWLMGLTAYHFGVVTIIYGVVAAFGFTALQTVAALAPGYSMTYMICPIMPSALMLIGVMGIDLKDHVRFCALPCFLMGVVWLIVNVILGVVPFGV